MLIEEEGESIICSMKRPSHCCLYVTGTRHDNLHGGISISIPCNKPNLC